MVVVVDVTAGGSDGGSSICNSWGSDGGSSRCNS